MILAHILPFLDKLFQNKTLLEFIANLNQSILACPSFRIHSKLKANQSNAPNIISKSNSIDPCSRFRF